MTRAPVYRPRIRSGDAPQVRARVQAAAAGLGLRCGLLAVFTAVLGLTVSYKRLRDDEVAIRDVAKRLPMRARGLSATTIGRLLARLDELELIVYRPARGRGKFAYLAIHPRFCEGVSELPRDENGRVFDPDSTPRTQPDDGPKTGVNRCPNPAPHTTGGPGNVKFYAPPIPLSLVFPRKTPPLSNVTTDAFEAACSSQPVEVDIQSGAVKRVMDAIPECYRATPRPVRTHIRATIATHLARGWREEQIIDVLAAPLPADVRRPLVLARIRFAKAFVGAGPRLRPLQRAWERAQDTALKAGWTSGLSAQYQAIVDEVGADLAQRMAIADRHRTNVTTPGRTGAAIEDEQLHDHRATVNAVRVIRREYPYEPLQIAARQWLAIHEPHDEEPAPHTPSAPAGDLWLTIEDLISATPSGRCMSCGCIGAITREDLPAPAPVCADCWDALGHDDTAADCTTERPTRPLTGAGWSSREAC